MVEKIFYNKNVSNSIRNQIITIKNVCGWKKSLYYIDHNSGIDFLKYLQNHKPQFVKEVLAYILRNFLNKLENCIELLIDKI